MSSRLVYEEEEEEGEGDQEVVNDNDQNNGNEIKDDIIDFSLSSEINTNITTTTTANNNNNNKNNDSKTWKIINLEKRGRGRGTFNRFILKWSIRTFNLIDQTLIYYDNNIEKGCIDIKNSMTTSITPNEADKKPFAFVITMSSGDKLYLNASDEESRQHCISVLNYAAQNSIEDRIISSDMNDTIEENIDAECIINPDPIDPHMIYDEDLNLITTYFEEGTLGVILKRRIEDGIAYIADVASNSQAMDLDVSINDELWSINDNVIGKQYLNKEKWNELVELIKNNPRPLKLVWHRKLSIFNEIPSNHTTDSPKPIKEIDNIEEIPISIITDINSFIEKEEIILDNNNNEENIKTNNKSYEYERLESLLGKLVRKQKDFHEKLVNKSFMISQDYMYLLQEDRILLKRGDLISPDGNNLLWTKTNIKKHIILLSDLLIITTPIINNNIANNFLPLLNLQQLSTNNAHEQQYLVENVIDLQVCKLRSDAHVFGCGESTMIGSNQVVHNIKNSENAENFFQILWPGGVLQFIAENKASKEVWVLNLFLAICNRVGKEEQVIGWRHQYMLGTMHSAVLSRDEMKVRELIEMCENGSIEFASIDAFDEDGYTPLHYACMLRMSGIIRALHEATADVTATDKIGLTPLHWIAMQLDDSSLALLCAHVFDIDYYDHEGRTPLYMACVEGRDIFGKTDSLALTKCISCMLNHQPNVNIIDKAGYSIIHYLAASWQYDALELLLEAGANVNIKAQSSYQGMTALHLAVIASPIKSTIGEGMRIIFKTDSLNLDTNNSKRFEDLNKPYGSLTLRTLLKYGAKPNIKDIDGKTIIQLLLEKSQLWDHDEFLDAIAVLLSFGTRIDDANILNNLKLKLNSSSVSIQALIDKWNSLPVINGDQLELGLNCFKPQETTTIENNHQPIQQHGNRTNRNSISDMIVDTNNSSNTMFNDKCQLCHISFTLFRRQHHCRLCNALCCDDCSKKRVIIMDNSSRACDSCYNRAMHKLEIKNHDEILSRMKVLPKSNQNSNHIIIDIKDDKKQLFGNAVLMNKDDVTNNNTNNYKANIDKSMNTFNETHNKLLERGEKLSKLQIKSEEMSNQANEFAKLAKQLAEQQKSKGWF